MKKILPLFIILILLAAGVTITYSALQNTSAKHHEMPTMSDKYSLEVTKKAEPTSIKLNEPTKISYVIKNAEGEIVKDFAIAHEKLMHFIIVRKDLIQFQHLHPEFDKTTGEFTIDVTFTVDGHYRFFADFTPKNEKQTTLFSDMEVGSTKDFQPHSVLPDTETEKAIPPDYQVSYILPETVEAQKPYTYSLEIKKNNSPVELEPYLGAMGHSVIIKEGSLAYIHAHPDAHAHHTPDAAGNKVTFTTSFPEKGNYRLFTQFQHEKEVHTTEHTLSVK